MLAFWTGFVCGALVVGAAAALLAAWVDHEEKKEAERREVEEALGQRLR